MSHCKFVNSTSQIYYFYYLFPLHRDWEKLSKKRPQRNEKNLEYRYGPVVPNQGDHDQKVTDAGDYCYKQWSVSSGLSVMSGAILLVDNNKGYRKLLNRVSTSKIWWNDTDWCPHIRPYMLISIFPTQGPKECVSNLGYTLQVQW